MGTALRAADAVLRIYFIDVEGGQATLVVTPRGESLLIDAGFAGAAGTFASRPGDPAVARDAQRILAAARDAGVSRIDRLLITHFHADHMGGVPELAQLLPIDTFIDHGDVARATETTVPGTLAAYDAYAAVRSRGRRHVTASPGARLALRGVQATVVSAAGATLTAPLRGAGTSTPGCAPPGVPAQEVIENPRSTGILLQFGRFRFLDLGDLAGAPLFALACPRDLIGPVDLYLVAHHGGVDAPEPSTFTAWRPRAAVMNNGALKGGAAETFELLQRVMPTTTVWQLHQSAVPGARNFPDAQIANLDEQTAHWVLVRARTDGAFEVSNGRTGATVSFPAPSSPR